MTEIKRPRRKLLKVAALGASTAVALGAVACSSSNEPLLGTRPADAGKVAEDGGPIQDSTPAMPDSALVGRPPQDGGPEASPSDSTSPNGCEVGSCDAGILDAGIDQDSPSG